MGFHTAAEFRVWTVTLSDRQTVCPTPVRSDDRVTWALLGLGEKYQLDKNPGSAFKITSLKSFNIMVRANKPYSFIKAELYGRSSFSNFFG